MYLTNSQQNATPAAPETARAVLLGDGLVGFPSWRRFTLAPAPGDLPVLVLSSLDEEGLCFLAVDPRDVIADYAEAIADEDLHSLGLADAAEALLLALLTVEHEPLRITANLLGPVIINPMTGAGRQLVLAESGYATRHLLTSVDRKDLTPPPPSLRGKGETCSPPRAGEGLGERSAERSW